MEYERRLTSKTRQSRCLFWRQKTSPVTAGSNYGLNPPAIRLSSSTRKPRPVTRASGVLSRNVLCAKLCQLCCGESSSSGGLKMEPSELQERQRPPKWRCRRPGKKGRPARSAGGRQGRAIGAEAVGARASGAQAFGARASGAQAFGALAVGASLSGIGRRRAGVGRLAIGRLSVGRSRIGKRASTSLR